MIVVDASAALDLLLRTSRGREISSRLRQAEHTLHAPHLIDIEVLQVIRRYTMRKVITASRAEEAIRDFLDLPMERYPHEMLLPRIWELRHNATAYDASYLALSELLGAPLITCDAGLAASAGHAAQVVLVR